MREITLFKTLLIITNGMWQETGRDYADDSLFPGGADTHNKHFKNSTHKRVEGVGQITYNPCILLMATIFLSQIIGITYNYNVAI